MILSISSLCLLANGLSSLEKSLLKSFARFLFFCVFFLTEVQLIYTVVPISAIQQSDSVLHIYTFFLNILFHYGLSQETGYSSLCYTVGPCHSSILNVIVYIYQPQTPTPSLSLPASPLATTSLISMSVSLFLFSR